jgi:dihydroorotate dehydrogenase
MSALFDAVRPLLFAAEPEVAHTLAMKALKLGLVVGRRADADPRLSQTLLGLTFANPIGLAAGFDKDGEVPGEILRLGFGFVEVGTVTPLPQAGNPKPRLFRLAGDAALINRMGFNNHGFGELKRRLAGRSFGGILGVNIGANKLSRDRLADYVAGVEAFAAVADYLAINVSSPNTPGLRDLQGKAELVNLLGAVTTARTSGEARFGRKLPLFLKIAPDLEEASLADIAEAVLAAGIDGVIVSNTTVSRDGLADLRQAKEAGGLSGRPLFRRSTILLAKLRLLVGKAVRLVGVGGVDSGETALAKLTAGADLVQLYTGFIFRGPQLASEIAVDLGRRLDASGARSIGEVVGTETEAWAAKAP